MDPPALLNANGVETTGVQESEGVPNQRQRVKAGPKSKKPPSKKPPVPTLPNRPPRFVPTVSFEIQSSSHRNDDETRYCPRIGRFTLRRPQFVPSKGEDEDSSVERSLERKEKVIEIETPGMICGASRGMVKHLSRDNVQRARGVEWIHIPLEEFLEHPLPIPAVHPSLLPLHTFLTHPPERHILSISLRDPADNRNMPANTNAWVQTNTVRGVRKVAIDDWIQWARGIRPDLVWAFVDIPKSLLGGDADEEAREVVRGEGRQTSQKRITKCLERSSAWMLRMMGGLVEPSPDDPTSIHRPPIIVPLMGGCDPRARKEFSRSLVEKLDNVDRQVAKGLKKLDDAVTGYAFEMVDLPTNAYSMPPNSNSYPQEALDVEDDDDDNSLTELVKASLRPLDGSKLRIAHSTPSPHAMLRLVLECGIDLFDVPWVAEAADLGIALDFEFPARNGARERALETDEEDGQRSLIGHNLFDERFAQDLGPLGNSGACSSCWACKPTWVSERVIHSTLDGEQWEVSVDESGATLSSKGFSRAYLHHLLHTHEMSAYALLHLHNLAIADSFFANLRRVLASEGEERFKEEVIRFYQAYELPEQLFDEARARWKEVEDSRGKGRLKREREALSRINGTIDSTLPVVSPESEGLNDDGELTPKASAVAVILEGVEDLTI